MRSRRQRAGVDVGVEQRSLSERRRGREAGAEVAVDHAPRAIFAEVRARIGAELEVEIVAPAMDQGLPAP